MLHSHLNPIYDYAAKGQYYENRSVWEKSVHWYQRALACLPNLYGAGLRIKQGATMNSASEDFTARHAARIYAALGSGLWYLDRLEDSLMAFQAAHSLDPENRAVLRSLPDVSKLIAMQRGKTDVLEIGTAWHPHARSNGFKDKLTVLMVTHCTRRLKIFATLAPPSSKLVTATYGSLVEIFGNEVCDCRKILCYDGVPNEKVCDAQYGRSLEQFAHQYGFELITYPGVGLFKILQQTMAGITTPYTLFVEHDWLFQGASIDLQSIIAMMDNVPRIHSIRFNKRDNLINGHDFILSVDTDQKCHPLLRTASHSNNPSIFRTAKLKNEWLPICAQALRRVCDHLGGSAFGIEEILFKRHVEGIRNDGFDESHHKWGSYLYGHVGDPPRIIHIGE